MIGIVGRLLGWRGNHGALTCCSGWALRLSALGAVDTWEEAVSGLHGTESPTRCNRPRVRST